MRKISPNRMYSISSNNRLVLDAAFASEFTVPVSDYGSAIAFSPALLIVFHDEYGVKETKIDSSEFAYIQSGFYRLFDELFYYIDKLGPIRRQIKGRSDWFVWDDAHVYYLNGPVEGADPETFQLLGEFWARDATQCFFQNMRVKDADTDSFRVIETDFAADRRWLYGFLGRRIMPYVRDPKPLGRGYYDIDGRIFFGDEELSTVDRASFRVLPLFSKEEKSRLRLGSNPLTREEELSCSDFTACDKNRAYRGSWSKP